MSSKSDMMTLNTNPLLGRTRRHPLAPQCLLSAGFCKNRFNPESLLKQRQHPLSLDGEEELFLSLSLCHSKQGFDGRGEGAVFDGQWANASASDKGNSNL